MHTTMESKTSVSKRPLLVLAQPKSPALESLEKKTTAALFRLKTHQYDSTRLDLLPDEMRLLASLVGGHIVQHDLHHQLNMVGKITDPD